MTFEDLMKIFDKAHCDNIEDPNATVCADAAGVRAVLVAVRDAVIPWHVANDHRYSALEHVRAGFSEFLSDEVKP